MEDYDDEDDENDDDDGDDDGDDDDDKFDNDDNDDNDANDDVENCRGPDWAQNVDTHTLCEPAQSKCMSTCHKRHQKSQLMQKFTGKMPRPILGPERGLTLCAGLRSRNACQDFTRATSEGNLHVKCRRPKLRCRLGASLRNRDACQNFTRATSHRNLQGRGPK